MKKLSIGIFISDLEGGGAERVVVNLANSLVAQNNIYLILRYKKGVYLDLLNQKINIIELQTGNPFKQILKLIKTCRQENIDVLLSTPRYQNILSLFSKPFINSKVVIREATTFNKLQECRNSKNIIEYYKIVVIFKLMKLLYRYADLVIANSSGTANDLLTNLVLKKDKLVVIYNPLYDSSLEKKGKEKIDNYIFEKLTRPILISVGRLVYQKNYQQIIKSFALIKKEYIGATLVILGAGPDKPFLQKLIEELNLRNSVYFLGFVQNPYKYMKHADLFVLSSIIEGFGNVVVEALAMEIPIVANDCPGGPAEILDYGKYGKLVEVNNISEMVDAIKYQLNSKINKEELLNRAKYFSVDRITGEYLKYFNEVLNK